MKKIMSGPVDVLVQQVLDACPAEGRVIIAEASFFTFAYVHGMASNFFEVAKVGDRRWWNYFVDSRSYVLRWCDPNFGDEFVRRVYDAGLTFGIDMEAGKGPDGDLRLARAYVERR